MSFQAILNIASNIQVNNHKVAGIQAARSGVVRTVEYPTGQPWLFTVTPNQYLPYSSSRDILGVLQSLDRTSPGTLRFDDTNSGQSLLGWFSAYRGAVSFPLVNSFTFNSKSGNVITLNVAGLTNGTVVFRPGDLIQLPATSAASGSNTARYVYQVIATSTYVSGTTITVTVNRPVIGAPTVNGTINVGPNCYFEVIMEKYPNMVMQPSNRYDSYVGWDSNFVFRENIVG